MVQEQFMFSHDILHSVRLLIRHRRTTIAAVLMLGLGIGANIALFTVVNAAFIRPLPYRDPDRLVFLFASFPGLSGADLANFSFPDFEDVRRTATSFEAIAAQTDFTGAAIEGPDGPARVQPNFIEGPYLEVLGAAPVLGRGFTADEMARGSRLMMLSHGAWIRMFGADRSILGRVLRLNGVGFEVIGVMPDEFFDLAEREGRTVDLWLPMRTASIVMSTFDPASRGGRLLWGVARLKPGVTAREAEHELAAISARLARQYPDTNRGFGVHATPVRDIFFTEMRLPLRLLAAGAAFVLLIVCCNVAALLVARGAARQRELALRFALGATRGRLVRQLLVESVLLAGVAAILSLAVAVSATRTLLAFGGIEFPGFVNVGIDRAVIAMAVMLAAAAGIAAGLVPAVVGWRRALNERLTTSSSQRVWQRPAAQFVLVAAQVAVAIVLVTGAWLMLGSSVRLARTGLGFDTERLLTMRIDLPAERYGQPAQRALLGAQLRERVAAVPGVESAILWGPGTPGHATWVAFVAPEERVIHSEADFQMAWRHGTNPGGMKDLGIRLIEGRDFTSADTLDASSVVIVGRSVANELWPGKSPIGRRMRLRTTASTPPATVIGVAEDVWMRGRFRFGELDPRRTPQRDIYFPYAQRPHAGLVLLVRAAQDGSSISGAARAAIAQLDPMLPTYEMSTMQDILLREERHVRFAAVLMGVYGIMSLVLAGFGVYAVLSFTVLQRTREIGLRIALGAARLQVVAGIARSVLLVIAIGSGIGLLLVAIGSPFVRALVFNLSPLDVRILAGACALLACTGAAAGVLPAWRAASVDPAAALRQE